MILIAFGANLPSAYGSPLETLREAIRQLDSLSNISVISVSNIYISAPVPISDQPWYHNGVLAVDTDLEPRALLDVLQGVEADFGRERGERNAARVLDLDIVAYNDAVLDDEGLQIPHPRMAERAFVVMPLRDIAPEWQHPVTGLSMAKIIEALPAGQNIQKIEAGEHDTAA